MTVTIETSISNEQDGATCCSPFLAPRIDTATAQSLVDELSLLAHPIRLQILDMLAQRDGQVCVCDLEAALPVKQPTVSHHLKLLRAAGLIAVERRGLWAYYSLQRAALAALRDRVVAQFARLDA
jgi:ArsR family transcriptional regulator